jgi:hypothetical protein
MTPPDFRVPIYKEGNLVRLFDDVGHRACSFGTYSPPFGACSQPFARAVVAEGLGSGDTTLYQVGPNAYVVVVGEVFGDDRRRRGELLDAAGVVGWWLKNYCMLPPFHEFRDTVKSLELTPEGKPTVEDCLSEEGKIRWRGKEQKVRPGLRRFLHRFLSGDCRPLDGDSITEIGVDTTVRNCVSGLNRVFKALDWPWRLGYRGGYIQKIPR